MLFDWYSIPSKLSEHLEHYIAQNQPPINQVFHLLGVPMIVLAVPAGIISPILGFAMAFGGASLQLVGQYLYEQQPFGKYAGTGPIYLLAVPLFVVEKLLAPLGLSLSDLLRLVAKPTAT